MLSTDNASYLVYLFYAFSSILIFAALKVVTSKNPVHSAMYLVLSFFSASAIWIILKAEFLAITLVLVYVGAVMVLFLFVVMMASIKEIDKLRKGFWTNLTVAAPVCLLVVFEMIAIILHTFRDNEPQLTYQISSSNTYQLGLRLYTEYFYPFQIAAILLLLAMVSAIALTLRGRKQDAKGQDPSSQVRVNPKDRLSFFDVSVNSDIDPKK
ncbi:MAG: NADH:ubiquinone oxidoreductase subunit J [Betaproteobacteria bacterium TMED41]|nr:MAG: NADH:ubiquinone oxidoreductase subunit J [Betaproteobacteria bacterium TMED41]